MRLSIIATVVLTLLAAGACSPQMNWRQTDIAPSTLQALFPCKPERASRTLDLGGQRVELTMSSCTTAGVTVGIGLAPLPNPSAPGLVLAQWRLATLATLRAGEVSQSGFGLEKSLALPDAVRLSARGSGPDGKPLQLQAAWFVRGSDAFVALMYGPTLRAEDAEMFFSGLRFR